MLAALAIVCILEVLLLFLFLLLCVGGVLHGKILESLHHIVAIGVLRLGPLHLVQVLPQGLHDAVLETLERFLLAKAEKPGVGRAILHVMVEDE